MSKALNTYSPMRGPTEFGAAVATRPFWPVLVPREPRFVYNPSASVAPGWYRIERLDRTGSLRVGSTLLVRLPADVAALAAQRGYLPSDVPIIDEAMAMPRNHGSTWPTSAIRAPK